MSEAPPVACRICGTALVETFATEECRYRRCPRCGYLSPDLDGVDGLAVNQAIFTERFDQRSEAVLAADAKKRRKHARLLRTCEDYRRTGRLLDVGCGAGRLLLEAADLDWEPWGVDPSMERTSALELGAVRILCRPLEDCGFEDGAFDIVHANEVLEYVTDVRALLEECTRVLRPGGLLVLRTPNHDSWTVGIVGTRWRHFGVVRNGHVGFFAPATMRWLLAELGYDILSVRTQHFSLRDRWSDKTPVLGGLCRFAYKAIGFAAAACGKGERLTALARKLS